MEYGMVILGLVLGGVIGYLMGIRKGASRPDDSPTLPTVPKELFTHLELEKEKAEKQLEKTQFEQLDLERKLARRDQELIDLQTRLDENKKEIEQLQKRFQIEFENVANKLLDEKSKKFTEHNSEQLDRILKPFKDKLKDFEEKVDKTYKDNRDEQISLKEQIKGLHALNVKMSKEALELTHALKGDSKTRGDWGEFQLNRLLEQAGLTEGVHFETQGGFKDDEGRLKKPDFIVHLPDNKHLIIDAKVSLVAYEQYYSADDDASRREALKHHLESIKTHIRGLGSKKYEELYDIQTPDYVMMYIPIEPAFFLALEGDKEGKLYSEALERNVVLVSSSTLMATLRTVGYIWKQEKQAKNVQEIADRGAKLYDKFVGFVDSLTEIGSRLEQAQKSYNKSIGQLSEGPGNLIGQAEKLKSLGLKTNKSLPEGLK